MLLDLTGDVPRVKAHGTNPVEIRRAFQQIDDFLKRLTSGGILVLGSVSITGAYSVGSSDSVVLGDGTFDVTLPLASGMTGHVITVKNTGAGTITVTATDPDTIDGETEIELAIQYESIDILSDGSDWWII